MIKYFIASLALVFLLTTDLRAQEIDFTIKINAQRAIDTDPRVFESMEVALVDFLKGQKWTSDEFQPDERIKCNILLTITKENGGPNFEADLAIQSSRPIYGSDQETQVFNHIDNKLAFSYEQARPLIFSRNRFDDNLTSVLAFYTYVVLGFDYDTFALLGGEKHFQTAQDIANNLPSNLLASDDGWAASGNRNRHWLLENILSPRMRPLRRALYTYHRQGLDMMHEDIDAGREALVNAVEGVQQADQNYPNTVLVQSFVNAKGVEVVEIFKRGTQAEQAQIIQMMSRIDPSNSARYRAIR